MSMYKPIINGYYSGAWGLEYGLQDAGCEIQQSLEYDPICCKTIRLNSNHPIIQQDIRTVTVCDQPDCDAMAITYPCNKYSTIADIHGSRTGEDHFLHGLRQVVLKKPAAFTLENVPGMMKFKVVMECFTKLPGYYVNVFCPLDAANWLPQRRERLILIATRKPFHISAPKPALRKVRLKDIIERNARIEIPDYAYKRMAGGYRDLPIISDPLKDDIAPTCVAHYSKDVSTRMVKVSRRVRPYTPREYARLQGFPDSFKFAGTDRQQYKQIGNAVAIPVGRWIGQQLVRYFNK